MFLICTLSSFPSLTCVKDRDPYYFPFLIPDYDAIISKLRIICMAWLLEIDVENICLFVIRGPYFPIWSL